MIPTFRKELRVPVFGTIRYSCGPETYEGTVKNVSIHGCQVVSHQPPPLDTLLSYHMHLADIDGPLEVTRALVQWVSQNEFGLKTLEMPPDTLKRLRRFLDDGYLQMARARRGWPTATREATPAMESELEPPHPGGHALGMRTERGRMVTLCPEELSTFVGWILDARRAFHMGSPVPDPPGLEVKEFAACTRFIHRLLDQNRRAQEADEPRGVALPPGRGRDQATGLSAPTPRSGSAPHGGRPAGTKRRQISRPGAARSGEVGERVRSRSPLAATARRMVASFRGRLSRLVPLALSERLRLPAWPFGIRR